MKVEGRLGEAEIEIGGERFAAGDQVITRLNDHRNRIYNRERWRVAEVDPRAQTVALDGIDTARRVCVDSVFLGRVRERDGGPAVEHAYAATTYQAQGATVDRAFIAAEPSMDRQEFYVAASRSREETFFYATPEIQIHREEIAPADPFLREGIQHIAEAAQRDGAQVSAHDQALRARLSPLSTEELHARPAELTSEVGAEAANQRAWERLSEHRAENEVRIENVAEGYDVLGEPPSRFARREVRDDYRRRVADLEMRERLVSQERERLDAERARLEPVEHAARAEVAMIEHLIGGRERARLEAIRLDPPDYITRELGERPSDPSRQAQWDKAVRGVERYRQQHGIVDRDSALGGTPKDRSAELAQQQARRSLQRSQEALQLRKTQTVERSLGIER